MSQAARDGMFARLGCVCALGEARLAGELEEAEGGESGEGAVQDEDGDVRLHREGREGEVVDGLVERVPVVVVVGQKRHLAVETERVVPGSEGGQGGYNI